MPDCRVAMLRRIAPGNTFGHRGKGGIACGMEMPHARNRGKPAGGKLLQRLFDSRKIKMIQKLYAFNKCAFCLI
jgi:hypothetical protein